MENARFDARAMRLAATPKISQSEMARQMRVSRTFYVELETGTRAWPDHRKTQFIGLLQKWKICPVRFGERKPRNDQGIRRGVYRPRRKPELISA